MICYNAPMRFAVLLTFTLWGCSKSSQSGLPPATDWSADDVTAGAGNVKPKGVPEGSPHGGGGDVHAGALEGDDDNNDEAPNDDVHRNLGGGTGATGGTATDVTKLGLESPDPNRPIDPSHRIRGIIKLSSKIHPSLKPDGPIFLIVKRPGPDGQPMGSPLAVDKVLWTGDGLGFELTERQAMISGTEMTGEVIVIARYDQDSDAMTKQPGDVVGMARVKIPADGVVIELDTLLP